MVHLLPKKCNASNGSGKSQTDTNTELECDSISIDSGEFKSVPRPELWMEGRL